MIYVLGALCFLLLLLYVLETKRYKALSSASVQAEEQRIPEVSWSKLGLKGRSVRSVWPRWGRNFGG